MSDQLSFMPALRRLDLVAVPVATLLRDWKGTTSVEQFLVAEIDPDSSGGAAFCARYGFKESEGANCVVVVGQRGSTSTFAAVVIPVGRKTDFNRAVRKHLGVRQVSLAPLETVLADTKMEYGSITPIGLPPSWQLLIDSDVALAPRIVIGSGLRHSKLSVPGPALLELANAVAIEGLALPLQ